MCVCVCVWSWAISQLQSGGGGRPQQRSTCIVLPSGDGQQLPGAAAAAEFEQAARQRRRPEAAAADFVPGHHHPTGQIVHGCVVEAIQLQCAYSACHPPAPYCCWRAQCAEIVGSCRNDEITCMRAADLLSRRSSLRLDHHPAVSRTSVCAPPHPSLTPSPSLTRALYRSRSQSRSRGRSLSVSLPLGLCHERTNRHLPPSLISAQRRSSRPARAMAGAAPATGRGLTSWSSTRPPPRCRPRCRSHRPALPNCYALLPLQLPLNHATWQLFVCCCSMSWGTPPLQPPNNLLKPPSYCPKS